MTSNVAQAVTHWLGKQGITVQTSALTTLTSYLIKLLSLLSRSRYAIRSYLKTFSLIAGRCRYVYEKKRKLLYVLTPIRNQVKQSLIWELRKRHYAIEWDKCFLRNFIKCMESLHLYGAYPWMIIIYDNFVVSWLHYTVSPEAFWIVEPDEPFYNFRALRAGDQWILCI